jgi:metal-responsive CopG/Arc/MetJ family transcriptional regulator
MKTAISIPDPVFAAAEEVAKKLGVSRSELYSRAIESFVRAWRDEDVTEALNRVYATEPSELDPALARAQSAAIGREKW